VATISQSAFAKLAGVSRQAIHNHIKAGSVVKTKDGTIDLEDPINSAYLTGHMAGTARKGPPKGSGGRAPKSGSKRRRKSTRVDQVKKDPDVDPEPATPKEPKDPPSTQESEAKLEALRKLRSRLDGESDPGDDPAVEEMVQFVQQKGYWDTLKAREEAKTKQLIREERIGNLADISIVLAIIEAHKHGLVANFVDSIQRQAMQICSMVGAEGKERIVEDYLEKENKRRLEEADRTAARVADRLKRGLRQKRAAERSTPTETGAEDEE
jgi:hypothetical protein